ncbi:hypothetical protein Tco_0464100 [Tanacetum coccineum]
MDGNSPKFRPGLIIAVPRMAPLIGQYWAQPGFDGGGPVNHLRHESKYVLLDDKNACYLYPSSIEGSTAKSVGLRLVNSHTGNHRKDDFTPLKTIRRFLALGWLLEEIHVTLAHLEKKRTRLRTYTKSLEDLCKQWLETALQA